ncbi:hypothetical protein MP35_18560 [Escherichia coli N40513]|nr:conserved hypothetical protein [Escherichia coli H299]KDX48805.1 hypothetical protein AC69_4236 [Escherichia coli 2-177-06_S4_C1]OMI52625.1 hypothetical protein MP35_18560 [Escherichia coli N40513]
MYSPRQKIVLLFPQSGIGNVPWLMPLAASGTAGLRRDLISSALIPITEVPPAQTSVPADISQYRQAVMQ